MSGQLHKVSLSRLSSLANPLGSGRLILIVILIKMFYFQCILELRILKSIKMCTLTSWPFKTFTQYEPIRLTDFKPKQGSKIPLVQNFYRATTFFQSSFKNNEVTTAIGFDWTIGIFSIIRSCHALNCSRAKKPRTF